MATVSLTAAPVEFFRPESERPLDADGFEIDSATREIAEIDTWLATQADIDWLNAEPYQPTDDDWDQMHAMSYGFGDDDLAAAGLPVG